MLLAVLAIRLARKGWRGGVSGLRRDFPGARGEAKGRFSGFIACSMLGLIDV